MYLRNVMQRWHYARGTGAQRRRSPPFVLTTRDSARQLRRYFKNVSIQRNKAGTARFNPTAIKIKALPPLHLHDVIPWQHSLWLSSSPSLLRCKKNASRLDVWFSITHLSVFLHFYFFFSWLFPYFFPSPIIFFLFLLLNDNAPLSRARSLSLSLALFLLSFLVRFHG